jgi:fatty-acyl-CoA synthase
MSGVISDVANQDLYSGCTMGELFVRAARRFPDRIALVDGAEQITYREMGQRMARYAAVFAAAGLEVGDGVAQLSANRVDAVCIIGAISMAGLRYTPLHPLGSEDDQVYIFNDAEIKCVVIDERSFSERGRRFAQNPKLDLAVFSIGPSDFAESMAERAQSIEPLPLISQGNAQNIGLIMYTGGTTGEPKGVVHTHRSLVATFLINMAEVDWPQDIRFLAVTPVSHAALGFILPVLLRGGVFAMLPRFSTRDFVAAITTHRITATFLVPTMIYVLLNEAALAKADLSSLETVVYGASPMSPARMLEALERFGPIFVQIFGQTECPNLITALPKHDHDPARPEVLASCGRALIGNDVRLLGTDGAEVEQGAIGEICVRGPLVMHGYWKRPDATAEALAGGWLHTGDLARMDENGYFYIVNRVKDLIISGGFNVYPREIEDILDRHEDVALSCVIGVPDEKWGEAVLAIVVTKKDRNIDGDELIALVREKKGPVYAPKAVVFVDSIPLTGLGKPDKKAVRAAYSQSGERQPG